MLISKIATVKINSKTFKHYKDLGYEVKIGIELKVNVTHLTKAAQAKVIVKCFTCEKEKEIPYEHYYNNSKTYGYYTCNGKCSKIKYKQTCIEKFDSESFLTSNEFKEKQKEAFKKYGGSPFHNKEIQDKKKETNLKKYGFINPLQNEKVKLKAIETNLKKYGNKVPSKTEIVKQKFKKTCLERFGEITNLKCNETKIKIQKTLSEKYCINGEKIKSFYKFGHYNNFYYRSSYELDFIKFCEKNKIIITQGGSVSYNFKNEQKLYFYDFYLPNNNLIIEIKSAYTYKKELSLNLIKRNSCLSNGYNFLFIIDKKYDELISFIKD